MQHIRLPIGKTHTFSQGSIVQQSVGKLRRLRGRPLSQNLSKSYGLHKFAELQQGESHRRRNAVHARLTHAAAPPTLQKQQLALQK